VVTGADAAAGAGHHHVSVGKLHPDRHPSRT
jgi:hypothetical protein